MKALLNRCFNPQSIGVVGATHKKEKIGFAVMQNLRHFDGRVYPVNPKYRKLEEKKCYTSVKGLPEPLDLAIITTPLHSIPEIISTLGAAGCACALIMTGNTAQSGADRDQYELELLDAAKRAGVRLIGPGSLGIQSPALGLNATFGVAMPPSGRIACITQSGTIGTAILDWAADKKVGFSRFVALGGMVDIAFDDLIDYFGTDGHTNCILLYMERVTNARRFMSAARAFARSKPMVVLKAGVTAEGARAIMLHSGGAAGDDAIYDAAFQRAGLIRVDSIQELFDCAHALASQPLPKGKRLSIVTNAGGPAILASDELSGRGGVLTSLQQGPSGKGSPHPGLDGAYRNPVHVGGDGSAQLFRQALHRCFSDPATDGLLAIVTPQHMTDPEGMAQALAEESKGRATPVFASWMGQEGVSEGRKVLEAFGIPWYPFPERAVAAFMRMARYREMLDLLHETPPVAPIEYEGLNQTKSIINMALAGGRSHLSQEEAFAFLSTYGISLKRDRVVYGAEQAIIEAEKMGFPVELSPIYPEGSDCDIRIIVRSAEGVRHAHQWLLSHIGQGAIEATRIGVLVNKPPVSGEVLYCHVQKDDVFGPVIFVATEPFAQSGFEGAKAALPPLNMALAGHLISEVSQKASFSANSKLLKEYSWAFQEVLCRFAHLLVCEPQVSRLEAGPFVLEKGAVMVAEAQVFLDTGWSGSEDPHRHLSIVPYPEHWVKRVTLNDGTPLVFRPIRPEDGPLEAALIKNTSKESLYFRFFGFVPGMDQRQLARFTHIDYDREMAIVAVRNIEGREEMLGVVRIVGDAWRKDAEYAILIADAWHGKGLGSLLTDYIMVIARAQGYERITATFLKHNTAMRRLFERKQFTINQGSEDVDEAEWIL